MCDELCCVVSLLNLRALCWARDVKAGWVSLVLAWAVSRPGDVTQLRESLLHCSYLGEREGKKGLWASSALYCYCSSAAVLRGELFFTVGLGQPNKINVCGKVLLGFSFFGIGSLKQQCSFPRLGWLLPLQINWLDCLQVVCCHDNLLLEVTVRLRRRKELYFMKPLLCLYLWSFWKSQISKGG